MAIKRTSKSLGAPVRKSVMSAALRHVDIRGTQQMVSGDLYLGWLCKNKSCGIVIAISQPPAGGKQAHAETDDQLTVVKCPHCGNEDLYRWNARGEHKYVPKTAGA